MIAEGLRLARGSYYDDGLADDDSTGLCSAEVDSSRTTEWGENTGSPQFQLYFLFPNWVAYKTVVVTIGNGLKGVESCWNIEGKASMHGKDALTFTLGVRPSGLHEVGCILKGLYRGGAHIKFNGVSCAAPPPPPPQHYIPCQDAAFEIISEWDTGWQARVTVDDWRAGRLVRVGFGPRASKLKVSEVRITTRTPLPHAH